MPEFSRPNIRRGTFEKMPNLPNSTFRVLKFGAGGFSKTPPNPKHARYGLFVVLKFGAGHFQKILPTKSTISRPYIRRRC